MALPGPEEGSAPVVSGHRHVVVPTQPIGVGGRGTSRRLRGRKIKGGITDSELCWQHLTTDKSTFKWPTNHPV